MAPDAEFSWKTLLGGGAPLRPGSLGRSPHVAALALLPLVVLFLAASYRSRPLVEVLIASFWVALTAVLLYWIARRFVSPIRSLGIGLLLAFSRPHGQP